MKIFSFLLLSLLFSITVFSAGNVGYVSIEAGCDNLYMPYEFSENSEASGFNVDLIKSISKIMGFEIEIIPDTWNKIRLALEKGEIDMLTGMYYSTEREKDFSFSHPFLTVTHSFFSHDDKEIMSFEEVEGKTVAVQQGDIMHDYLKERELKTTIYAVDNPTVALRYVQEGKADCALVSKLQGEYIIRLNNFNKVHSTGPAVLPRDYCFAVRKGNEGLLDILNEGLSIAKKTGVYDEIYDRWFIRNDGKFDVEIMIFLIIITGMILCILMIFIYLFIGLKKKNRMLTEEKEKVIKLNETILTEKDNILNKHNNMITTENTISRNFEELCKATTTNFDGIFKGVFQDMSEYLSFEEILIYKKDSDGIYNCRFSHGINKRKDFLSKHLINPFGKIYGKIREGKVFSMKSSDFIMDNYYESENKKGHNIIIFPFSCGMETEVFMIIKLTNEKYLKNYFDEYEFAISVLIGNLMSTFIRIDQNEKIVTIESSMKEEKEKIRSNLGVSFEDFKKNQQKLYESEKFLALESLIGGISHEIKTPLGNSITITTYLKKIIEKNAGMSQEVEESFEMLYENLKNISDVIDKFKKREINKESEDVKILNFKDHLEDIIIAMRSVMLDKNIVIRVNCDSDLKIEGNPGDYYRLFSNLISNSVLHGFERNTGGEIDITAEKKGNNLYVKFEDNGKGIKSEHIKRIFDPFFSTKGGLSGSGMGLNIVYNLIRKNFGGEIKCESVPGKGTIFLMRMPL